MARIGTSQTATKGFMPRLTLPAITLILVFSLFMLDSNSIWKQIDSSQFPDTQSANGWSRANNNPLGIPQGAAPNLPSIRVNETHDANVDKEREIYGGKGDKPHLGGFTDLDLQGVSPATWRNMIEKLNVKSVLDVGCGRGISTSWFLDHGVEVLGVDGSHDAKVQSILDDPDTQMVEHDFSRGPWWPGKTYDAVWSVEFLEHVGVNFHFNYIQAFRKAAIIFCSSSRWGGWHHVEVHQDDWWILKYQSYGFIYSQQLTDKVRSWASEEKEAANAPNGEPYNAQHIWLSMKVFINPAVASLPEHAHLFFEPGCIDDDKQPRLCGEQAEDKTKAVVVESKLPNEFLPIQLTPEMDEKWESRIKQKILSKPKIVE